jgi:dolichyl-phosphate-mannose-protein mannosyltransferase
VEPVKTASAAIGAPIILMTIAPSRNFTTASVLGGVLLLLCALTFYYFAVIRIDYHKTALLDLGPYPDAVEYFAQAKAMLKEGWPSIQIGYDKLPSRYPFGYPALMLPWLKILREADSVLAPFRTNQTIGLLLLLGVFGFYVYLGMPLTGGCAALLLATLPGFFTYCRSSLSDISASLLYVLAFMFGYLGLKEKCRWKLYLSAIFLGLSLNIRMQSVFFAPLLLAMALFPTKRTRLNRFLHCAGVAIVFALAASPVLAINAILFGSPLKTGYDFWVPYWSESHLLFASRYVPGNAAALWRESALLPKGFNVANIFGTGSYFVAAFVVLVCVGLFFVRLTRFAVCAFLAGSSFLAATVCYKFGGDARFYLPILVLLVGVGAVPVTWAVKNLLVRKRTIAALSVFLLFAAACLGYPSRSGYNTKAINRSQAWDALRFTNPPKQSARFTAQNHFVQLFGSQPGIVLSDIDPVYLNALLPDLFIAAPIDGEHHYRFSKIWRYDRPQAMGVVKRGLHQGLPIYALFTSIKEMTIQRWRLPNIPGYQWTFVNNSDRRAIVLKLSPAATGDGVPQ